MTLPLLTGGSRQTLGLILMGAGAALGLRNAVIHWAQYKNLTLDHLLQCLRRSDGARREELEQVFTVSKALDFNAEPDRTILRLNYRQEQRDNFLFISEEYERIRHNGRLLKYWLDREFYDIEKYGVDCKPEVRERLVAVRTKAIEFCKIMRWVPYKVLAIGLLHPLDKVPNIPLPSITTLRFSRGFDILKTYAELAHAAVEFVAVGYSGEFSQALAQELGLPA